MVPALHQPALALELLAREIDAPLLDGERTPRIERAYVEDRELGFGGPDVRLDLGDGEAVVGGVDAKELRPGLKDRALLELRMPIHDGAAHLADRLPDPSRAHAPVAEGPRHHVDGRHGHDPHRGHALFAAPCAAVLRDS